ncbi:MAG: IS66 family transposase, partial [Thermodesulfobacteriota bacterium]
MSVIQGIDRPSEFSGEFYDLLDLFRTARPDRHEPVRIRRLVEIPRQLVRLFQYVLFTDDSIIPLQVKGNGKVKKARLWGYVRGGADPPLTVYDFSRDRSKQRPLKFLDGYQGYVHADAYSGYDELFRLEEIIEVGCWVHARRKFDEASSSRPV